MIRRLFRKKGRGVLPVLIVVGMLLSAAQAFALGRIQGQITDKSTGEPVAGVNVVVKGTYKGASTDLDGYYVIVGVTPGSYDLQATFIGYKVSLVTDVNVKDDSATTIDFAMEPTVLALGQEIIVKGKKPLFNVDETASARTVSSEDISELAVEDLDDVLAQQVGVVQENNEIHIRGGRADENLYIIDNLSVKDPISGQGLGIYISAESIKDLEVVTGGFNAEYGQAMSGLVNVETKEGGEHYSGSLSMKSDNLFAFPSGHQNTGNIEFSLGGPDPLRKLGIKLPGTTSFFINGYGYATDTHLPHATNQLVPHKEIYEPLALREENNYSALGKYTWRPSPVVKLSYSYGRSVQINQGYFDAVVEDKRYFPLSFMNIMDSYNTIMREGIQQTFNMSHTLSNTTFYEVTIGNFYNRVNSSPEGKHWSEIEQPRDIDPVVYEAGPDGEIAVRYGDGLWDQGNGNTYHDHYNDTWQLKTSITSQVHEKHQMKAGLEYEQTKLQLMNIHDPWIASTDFGGDYDMYSAMSEAGAMYVQDKVEFKGMIANVGIRLDWWRPGEYVEDAIKDPNIITLTPESRQIFEDETVSIFDRRIKAHVSPRLGISHPVTDSDVLFFSYGHFSQRPKYAYVFAKLRSYSPSTYQLFGNPNLNPQVTVAYEMGVKHRFSGDQVIELVAFYKDLFDYATSFKITSNNPRLGNVSFFQYFNMDYARVRGLEMRFRARRGRYLTGNFDFAYQIATGKSSSANAEIQAAADTQVGEKTLGEEYLSWDKPVRASATIWLRVPHGDHPRVFGISLPDGWGSSFRWDIQSGKRYTPAKLTNNGQDIQDAGERYSELSAFWNSVDLKIYKEYLLGKSLSMRAYVEALNVFDFKRPNQINPLTGEPYETGDLAPRSWENQQGFITVDPSRWKKPRQVFFGLSFKF